ncbi:MAG TPA: hypothetical protein VFO29_10215 [Candidatus Rubrimentiphilum sp.]|nr:hypothetical protein [Candidatus Rubrimentiphilum sp.]
MLERGIVTLSDAAYFPGLLALHRSIQQMQPYPVMCYDIGLTTEQLTHAAGLDNLHVLDLPDDPLIEELQIATAGATPLKKPTKRIWPLWICPLLIRAAPCNDVFWLDCDMLVLRSLGELFAKLDGGPVFTPENKAPHLTANSPELYDLMPIARSFDRNAPTVNGGVSGWRRGRDDAALAAYIAPIAAGARDARILAALRWHDQGALIWAIQSLGLEDRVLGDARWNLCVDHVNGAPDLLQWDDQLAARLREALPDVGIVHWNGRPVPWNA